MIDAEPCVFLVGAGPGDPGLLTLRAAEVLARADLVLYDQLVPRRLLDFANPAAETMCVRELPGNHPDKYPHIHEKLIAQGKAGKVVVRLKGGDPLIFGRGGEEAEALRGAGVPYEIVPGVTAASAAAAYLDLPLTHRHYASAVALVTGHELPHKPGNKLDWRAIAAFPGTLAIYMGIARLPLIVGELLKFGKPPSTPAAIVERASTGDMRRIFTTLGELERDRRHAGLEAPGLILIGDAVGHHQPLSWFEKRPLFGRRVLVTRPRHQAAQTLRKLELLGAVPYHLAPVEIRAPADWSAVDRAILKLQNQDYDWLVFTSANGVHGLFGRLAALGKDARILGAIKLAAVGPKTAAALREHHLFADAVPTAGFSSEGLAAELLPAASGQRLLLARANRGRDHLPKELRRTAAVVEEVAVYEQADAVDPSDEAFDALRRGEIGIVTFTSSNIARGILAQFEDTIRLRVLRGDIQLVCLSAETARAVQDLGFPVAATAGEATVEGLLQAVVSAAAVARQEGGTDGD
jgi:uroporphyrinogen III methyltransferase / synthase